MDNNRLHNTLSQTSSVAQKAESLPNDVVRSENQESDTISVEKLMHEGELALLHGEPHGLDFFEKASALCPNDHKLFLRQALAIFEFGSEEGKEQYLLVACKKFKAASLLNPDHFDIWQGWASCLLTLGNATEEFHYFQSAHDKYIKALDLSEGQAPDVIAELYWEFALVLMQIAHKSGEGSDYQNTIEAFEKAAQFQGDLPSGFWSQYAEANLALAEKINDVSLLIKAISYYKHAITLNENSFDEWIALGNTLILLYEKSHEEDHFSQANDCFAAATKLTSQDVNLWLSWAKLLWSSGYKTQNVKKLRASIEKCHRAYILDHNSAESLAIWAQSLAILGLLQEKLSLIQEAENKVLEAYEVEFTPSIFYAHGIVLKAFGHYYTDADYFYQAVEKFQEGLSFEKEVAIKDRLWFEMGISYTQTALILNDADSFKMASRFYSKAISHSPFHSYYYYHYAFNIFKLGELISNQDILEQSLHYFERALQLQKNAHYIHPNWLFDFACALDAVGDYYDDESYYIRALELFSHVLMIDPAYPQLHHRIGLAFSHLGELTGDQDHFLKALHHLRIAHQHDEESDTVLMDWGIVLINLGQNSSNLTETEKHYLEAEIKLSASAKLGQTHAYYHLACLHSLKGDYEKSIFYMEKAYFHEALPSLEELKEDEWLERLRMTSYFKELVYKLENGPNISKEL